MDPSSGRKVWNPLSVTVLAANANRLKDPTSLHPDPAFESVPLVVGRLRPIA